MYIYIHIHICISMLIYIYTYIYIYMYTCIQAVHHCRDRAARLADAGSSVQLEPLQGLALPPSGCLTQFGFVCGVVGWAPSAFIPSSV